MDVLQTWIVLGVPGLLLAGVLFVGHSQWRSLLGYAVLAGLVVAFALIPNDPISAAIIGVVLVVLVGSGRGQTDTDRPEHHQTRGRYTHVSD